MVGRLLFEIFMTTSFVDMMSDEGTIDEYEAGHYGPLANTQP